MVIPVEPVELPPFFEPLHDTRRQHIESTVTLSTISSVIDFNEVIVPASSRKRLMVDIQASTESDDRLPERIGGGGVAIVPNKVDDDDDVWSTPSDKSLTRCLKRRKYPSLGNLADGFEFEMDLFDDSTGNLCDVGKVTSFDVL